MTAGAFAEWQPRYAEYGIATFPVQGKQPMVRGYLRVGQAASRKLAGKFGDAAAFGLSLKPSGIAVVDVDTPDERTLADALDRHGPTPFIVRSGGGNFQAWYRRQDEGRRIRPDPDVPVDILGDGFVVAPPSAGPRRLYEIIEGSLADLARLPVLQNAPTTAAKRAATTVGEGRRNDTLWRHCMAQAHYCDDFDTLLDVARTANASYGPPLSNDEVVKTARSAWRYTERGGNWFGKGQRVAVTHDEIDGLMQHRPDAFLLLMSLRRRQRDGEFTIPNAMADAMPRGGWRRQRLADARQDLLDAGIIVLVRPASTWHGPAVYRF